MSEFMQPGPQNGEAPSTSDGSLLHRYRDGDGDAATQLYKKYVVRLLNLASAQASDELRQRVDPEDIVQSVFRTFFRRVSQGQYDVPDGEDLWKLLLVISLNKVRGVAAYHKAARRDIRLTSAGNQFDTAAEIAAGQDDLGLRVLEMTIEELLTPLPASYREVIRLRVEGHDLAEIVSRTGRARRSVERMLQEFRQQLQGLVNDQP